MAKRRGKRKMVVAAHAVPVMEVRNPAYQPGHPEEIERVTVVRALRDDPLGRLHARCQIGEAQYLAGRAWQELYEAAAVGGSIRSVDFLQEPVDGTKARPDPITDRMQKAMKEIMRLDRALGAEGCAIVRDVLAWRRSMEMIADIRGAERTRSNLAYFGRRLRECLTTLAKELGFRT